MIKEDDYDWIPVSEITTNPKGTYFLAIRNSWWVVNEKHQIALYNKKHPQCNASKEIVKRIINRIPNAKDIVYIPLAFIAIDLNDYRY